MHGIARRQDHGPVDLPLEIPGETALVPIFRNSLVPVAGVLRVHRACLVGQNVEVAVRDLIFGAGDRISGWGRVVVDSDGQWLDLGRAVTMDWSPMPSPRSSRSIRIDGLDLDAVPTEFAPDGSIPGSATLTGTWDGEMLHVESQTGARPDHLLDPGLPDWTTPPCDPPEAGWPTGMNGMQDQNLDFDLDDLTSTGAAVTIVTFRPTDDRAVLVVAATDADRVREVLGPQLPDRLCIVTSRWTRDELDSVRNRLRDRWDEWAVDTISEPCDERAQASVHVDVLRVSETLASWTETLPAGLLTVEAALAPVR